VKDPQGNTLLHFAALGGDLRIVTRIVAEGADVNARNTYGESAFSWAFLMIQVRIMSFLKENGFELKDKDLEHAARANHSRERVMSLLYGNL
jgi:ankyrin repeat protein